MSIRPIDLQVMVHRSAETSKLNHNSERSEVNYQQFADKFKQETVQKDRQVNELNKSEQNTVDKDGRGNSGGSSKKQDKKPPKKTEQTQQKKPEQGMSMFDISV